MLEGTASKILTVSHHYPQRFFGQYRTNILDVHSIVTIDISSINQVFIGVICTNLDLIML
jgi:predicted transcriptional regulator YheO